MKTGETKINQISVTIEDNGNLWIEQDWDSIFLTHAEAITLTKLILEQEDDEK